MSSDFYIARLVLGEQQGLCKVFTAPRSNSPSDHACPIFSLELTEMIHKQVFQWEKAGMDSLPKSRYGRFIHPGLLPDEPLIRRFRVNSYEAGG